VSDLAAIGIDVGGTNARAALVTRDGEIVERRRRPTPVGDADGLVATLAQLIGEFDPALPVGLGIAALVGPDGMLHYSPNIGVRDLPLAERLRAEVHNPVRMLNDASAAALGEQRAGAGRGIDDVVLLTIGTGVGGGVVADGRLVMGHQGFGAELGHLIVEPDGRRCPCGNRGCLEAYASGTAIGLHAREGLVDHSIASSLRDETELSGREVSAAAAAGDAFAASVLTEVGRWLGIAVASLTNALDPKLVLIGGGAAQATAPWVLPPVRETVARRIIGAGWRTPPTVQLASLGDDAGVIGAGLHAADLSDPVEGR
jgi:glucokinase